jgi:hypothetical protein
MNKLIILLIILIVVASAIALGIGLQMSNNGETDNDNNEFSGARWEDLYKFKQFLYNNYTVIEKRNSNTGILDKIPDVKDSVWIIIGLESEFSSEEASAVRNFVNSGGSLILAAESDFANKISRQFGVEFSTHRIMETELYDKNGMFIPMQTDIGAKSFPVLTNSPTGLLYDKNVTTIKFNIPAQSSDYKGFGLYSFLDLNDNGTADAEDVLGPIALMIEFQYGQGKIMFIGNTGLFMDTVWDRETYIGSYKNREFCVELLDQMVSKKGTVLYDFSKHVEPQSGHLLYPTD